MGSGEQSKHHQQKTTAKPIRFTNNVKNKVAGTDQEKLEMFRSLLRETMKKRQYKNYDQRETFLETKNSKLLLETDPNDKN